MHQGGVSLPPLDIEQEPKNERPDPYWHVVPKVVPAASLPHGNGEVSTGDNNCDSARESDSPAECEWGIERPVQKSENVVE